jgi:hypothetical protein
MSQDGPRTARRLQRAVRAVCGGTRARREGRAAHTERDGGRALYRRERRRRGGRGGGGMTTTQGLAKIAKTARTAKTVKTTPTR